jgi:hypothetical protein
VSFVPKPLSCRMKLFAIITSTLAFFQFFNDEPNEERKKQKEPEMICKGWSCKGLVAGCVKDPIDCPCPSGKRKCLVNDWFFCIGTHQDCNRFQMPKV